MDFPAHKYISGTSVNNCLNDRDFPGRLFDNRAFTGAQLFMGHRARTGALAGRLRRAQTFLRALGIEIVFGREGQLGTRTIRITAIGENRSHTTVSTVSRVSDNGHGASLNYPSTGLEQRFNCAHG
jgi:hypothetical protein